MIKPLKDVASVIAGQSPPSTDYNSREVGMPFFQGSADFGRIHPVARKWCSKPLRIAIKDDVLFSVRAPVGDVNIADQECCIGRGLAAIRADKKHVLPEYLLILFLVKTDVFEGMAEGTVFSSIKKSDLSNILVPILHMDLQKEISICVKSSQSHLDIANVLTDIAKPDAKTLSMIASNSQSPIRSCSTTSKTTTALNVPRRNIVNGRR